MDERTKICMLLDRIDNLATQQGARVRELEAENERLRGEVERMERWRDEADELAEEHFGQIHEVIDKLQMLLPLTPRGLAKNAAKGDPK